MWSSTFAHAQAPQDAAAAPADQQPAAQTPAPQQPAPAPQQPAETPTPQPESRRLNLPPAPPKEGDVRMPGEAGWNIGIDGWLPVGAMFVDKGQQSTFTDPSKLQMAGGTKGAFGADFAVAAGLHNTIRFSYFQSKRSGTTIAPNEMVIFSQTYNQGDQLTTNSKLQDYKLSFDYLTWPYPVGGRHFRLKTLWQVHYVGMKSVFDAPIRSSTPDSSGNYTSYAAQGSKGYFTPAFGLGVQEYASRNFRFEANLSGFWLPHRWHLVDGDVTVAYRFAHLELRGGAKTFVFRTSPKSDYFYRGTLGGVFVGVRWYSD